MKPGPAISAERSPAAGRSSFSMVFGATSRGGRPTRLARVSAMVRVAGAVELNAGHRFPREQLRDAFKLFGNRRARHYSVLLSPPEDGLDSDELFDSPELLLLPESPELELEPESAWAAFL